MGWTKYAMNLIVAAKKSNIKEIVWNARGVILKRPTGSQAIDISNKYSRVHPNKGVLFLIYLLPGLDRAPSRCSCAFAVNTQQINVGRT